MPIAYAPVRDIIDDGFLIGHEMLKADWEEIGTNPLVLMCSTISKYQRHILPSTKALKQDTRMKSSFNEAPGAASIGKAQ